MAGQRNGAPCVFATDLWSCLGLTHLYIYITIHMYIYIDTPLDPKTMKIDGFRPSIYGSYICIYIYTSAVVWFPSSSTPALRPHMALWPSFLLVQSLSVDGVAKVVGFEVSCHVYFPCFQIVMKIDQRWEVFNLLPLTGDEFNRFSHWAQMFFLLIDQLLVIEIHH